MDENTKYGGFWIRFVAFVIDSLILNFVMFLLILPLLGAIGLAGTGLSEMEEMDEFAFMSMVAGIGGTLYVIQLIVYWLYFALLESSGWQATLGKRAMGLKVVNEAGERISVLYATLRYIGKVISTATVFIGYIIAAFTPKKQALHDFIASTFVVKSGA